MRLSIIAILVSIAFISCVPKNKPTAKYINNRGGIFHTYYNIVYQSPDGADYEADIQTELNRLDYIFSTFKEESQLSKVNQNLPVDLDTMFVKVFKTANSISEVSGGAFDATVAPLVNIWGFGFKKRENVTQEIIDSIKTFVGYTKIRLENRLVVKDDPRTMIDFSAISKGYAVDAIGYLLAKKGCKNYMVEIGGEITARGVNDKGNIWRIGINEPNDNEPSEPSELQAVMLLKDKAIATSGNYRNFYIENGKKFAHTIDPSTGYPVTHSLLSASVIAKDCMTADAIATACMVLGVDKAKEMIEKLDNIDVYLIYATEDQNKVVMTKGFEECLLKN